jgi:hypothetical protein
MKKMIVILLGLGLLVPLTGCSLSLLELPDPLPTIISISSPTPLLATLTTAAPTPIVSTPTISLPTLTFGAPEPTGGYTPMPTSGNTPTLGAGGIIPGEPSGPYGVVLVVPDDVLNIRTGPGVDYSIAGSFSASAINIMRTGPASAVNGNLWVQVQNPGGGIGWVNATHLTEFKGSTAFCSDSRINTLLTNFGNALEISNGEALASLVSPAHGMIVSLWRNGNPITFDREHARWVFDSTFEHNWGSAPASGLDTIGSFQVKVLPWLQDVFNASYSLTCDSLGVAPQYGSNPWPVEYANVNYYTVYKPGTPGVDLDWRYWLVGVEYVQGQPFVFAVIHYAWEP